MNALLKNKISMSLSPYLFHSGVHINDIPEAERSLIITHSIIFTSPKKNVLYYEGEMPRGIYILKKGRVKASKINTDGSSLNHSLFNEGELFGYNSVLCEEKNALTVSTSESCELLFIEKNIFLNLLQNSPTLTQFFLKSISKEFTLFVNKVSVFARKKINERVALYLLLLNEKFKHPGQIADEAEITISRSDLAGFTGTTLENLVRTIKIFKDKDYIRTNGKSIYINDFEALHNLSGV